MLHELDELLEQESDAASHSLEAVHARLKSAMDALEGRIEVTAKALAALPTVKDELQKVREENARLKAEREDLKKSTQALALKNEKLTKEISHVSERLDKAIEKIGKLLEG